MINPNPSIVRDLKAYDKDLSVEWNNEYKYWEIYCQRPTGKKLITPIVESIYIEGGDCYKFCPLDTRILEWMRSADSKRVGKNWKWINRKRYDQRLAVRDRKTRERFENIAKENYNLVNNEMINPLIDETSWVEPDVQSQCRSKVMMRSGENAKKARGGDLSH